MKIGLLNELLSDISCKVSMPCEKCGNPAKNEAVLIKWDVVRNASAELCLDLSEACLVDRVEVRLGEKT